MISGAESGINETLRCDGASQSAANVPQFFVVTLEKAMSKKVAVVPLQPGVDIFSMQDAGYRFAQSGETMEAIARYVLGQCPTVLEDVPKEVKSALYAGFQLRKHELTGDKYYKVDGTTYIPLTGKPAGDDKGIVAFNVNVAMSYSPQEFGKMRESDPTKHAVIKPLRDAFSSYASNSMADLLSKIRRIVNEGKTRARAANKDFTEAMNKAFDDFDKRVRTAKDRGDVGADPVKFRVARDAFWRTYNAE